MADEVSVSAAARDEKSFTAAPNPLFKSYDQAAEPENWGFETDKHVDADTGGEGSPTASDGPRRLDDEPTALGPEEIASRLERTRREFYNRRKIIIKNLPADISNQVCNVTKKQLMIFGRASQTQIESHFQISVIADSLVNGLGLTLFWCR